MRHVSAKTIEALVLSALDRLLPSRPDAIGELRRLQAASGQLQLILPRAIARLAQPRLADSEVIDRGRDGAAIITIPIQLPTRGSGARVAAGAPDEARPDPVLIASLRKVHHLLDRRDGLPWLEAAPASAYDRRVMRLALLAPDIQHDILGGRQPPHFNLEFFMKREVPMCWRAQRTLLGR